MRNINLINPESGNEGVSFETLLGDCFSSGLLVVDQDGSIAAVNPDAAAVLSLSKDSGKLSLDDLPDVLRSMIREVQTTGRAVFDSPMALPSAAAPHRHVSVTILPVGSVRSGNLAAVLLKDVATPGSMESNLRRLDRLASVGTLAASMAHEIRNALVPIRTFVELLMERNPDAELSGIVRREMGRVDAILAHMLNFGAPAQPAVAPVRLHRLLEHALRLARHRVGGKVISISSDLAATEDIVTGDEHQLEQAFVNLLINAVEAMPSDGSLTVHTELIRDVGGALHEGVGAKGFVRVTIRDTGTGIAPENLQRVFEPFFTTKANGTGLGLAVTRRVIDQHKGEIRVDSEPGKGTTFTVQLPAGARKGRESK